MPLVSVIVPVYRVEGYLRRCVDSILGQTLTDIELILVDDGSPDNCGQICDAYAARDRRVKVVHKENGGLSDARNTGLDIASGEFIGFVDGDDYIEEDMYERLLHACRTHDSRLSMCGRYDVKDGLVSPSFSFDSVQVWTAKEATARLLIWGGIDSSACDKLFSRQLFSQIRFPVGRYNEDIFVMVKILQAADKVAHIGKCKYFYCHRPGSITSERFSKRKMDLLDASREVVGFVESTYPDLSDRAMSFYYCGLIYLFSLVQANDVRARYTEEHQLLRTLFHREFPAMITNPYLDIPRKAMAALMRLRLYDPVRKIWKGLRRA